MASTLNHTSTATAARKGNSLLPLLAREYPTDPQVEVLLRPRMPILQTGRKATEAEAEADAMDEDDESASDDEEAQEQEQVEFEKAVEETSRVAESSRSNDTARKEQDLVNWALKEYVQEGLGHTNTNAAGSGGATKGSEDAAEAALGQVASGADPTEVNNNKRQREEDEVKMADKRQKSIEPQATAAEDSDDDEFVVPEIVMGDSDDEE